jgi:hypothetical protein
VLQILIAIKNPSPRPCLNQRTLGPMSSTLTIIPQRRLSEFHTASIIALMMKVVHTSETSAYLKDTIRHVIPEGCHIHTHHHVNLKCFIFLYFITLLIFIAV